jgi:hypothetical protein
MAKGRVTIADAVLALIAERGPLTAEEIAPAMVAQGRTRAKDPVAAVLRGIEYEPRLLLGRDQRLYSLTVQLEGAVFTVAPTALERDQGFVLVRDELDLVRRALGNAARLRDRRGGPGVHVDLFGQLLGLPGWSEGYLGRDEDGEPVPDPAWHVLDHIAPELADQLLVLMDELGYERTNDEDDLTGLVDDMYDNEVLHGPDGWLPTLRSREILGLRIRGGEVSAEAIDRRELKGMHVEMAAIRIAETARFVLDAEEGLGAPAVPVEDLLELLATESPELFGRPLPPIGALLERGGFEVEDGLVGLPGAAWDDIRWALDPDTEAAWGFEPGDAVN